MNTEANRIKNQKPLYAIYIAATDIVSWNPVRICSFPFTVTHTAFCISIKTTDDLLVHRRVNHNGLQKTVVFLSRLTTALEE